MPVWSSIPQTSMFPPENIYSIAHLPHFKSPTVATNILQPAAPLFLLQELHMESGNTSKLVFSSYVHCLKDPLGVRRGDMGPILFMFVEGKGSLSFFSRLFSPPTPSWLPRTRLTFYPLSLSLTDVFYLSLSNGYFSACLSHLKTNLSSSLCHRNRSHSVDVRKFLGKCRVQAPQWGLGSSPRQHLDKGSCVPHGQAEQTYHFTWDRK